MSKIKKNASEPCAVMPLNKYIAHAGICSRRAAVQLIQDGQVTVNGATVVDPGFKVVDHAVKVGGRLIQKESPVYVVLNKPRGVVTTVSDEKGRKSVIDFVRLPKKQRLYPVGRLDVNTTGALLLTNDGSLAQTLSHPSNRMPKLYDVTVHKPLDASVATQLKKGVRLDDGVARVDACYVVPTAKQNRLRITLHSGKNRIVRRMLKKLGYIVEKLDRVSCGGVTHKGLARGEWRFLRAKEVALLKND